MTATRAFLISAPSSGSGKTVLTLGLLRALRRAGADVASGKCGPDYIDPAFHEAATGRPCATLDAWAEPPAALRARARATGAELLLVEGAMGLFDGAEAPGAGGTGAAADVARALGAPVVLVLDAARMAQTAGALVAGLARHRPGVEVAGVILNRVAGARHERMLAGAIAPVAPVLGAIARDARLQTPARHLGLVQAAERADLEAFVEAAADLVAQGCDLAALRALARPVAAGAAPARLAPLGARIAVARDVAFAFAYDHMLRDWRAQGAQVMPFSPLADEPPAADADAVFLPGGYPELHADRLAAATRFAAGMRAAAERGALIYGECGGYMTLGRGLECADGARREMLGLLPLETSFARRRRTLGYRRLTPRAGAPWAGPLAAHEHRQATTLRAEGAPLFDAADAAGRELGAMGLRAGRVCGSFAHVIAPLAAV
ncbi:cobyrinate a,c-diamide synthase [Oceanicella actignis]|uniref:cobyrinate a,c-diamide synthase n=1 Tax=Oceanicella actignis TaxID=1189325 RepID=UPI0011E7179D|nr:cobyrinate a,c-diamide synthase [Oceanicella actignis]TYO91329.1 cobyrinic acid a,c-diamide synthase [Oceanicella actignis]